MKIIEISLLPSVTTVNLKVHDIRSLIESLMCMVEEANGIMSTESTITLNWVQSNHVFYQLKSM